MAGIADVGAGKVQEPEKATGDVTIYFGIFFDGTNNHRLQVLIGKKYRAKHKVELKEKIDKLKNDIELYEDIISSNVIDSSSFAQYSRLLSQSKKKLKEAEKTLQNKFTDDENTIIQDFSFDNGDDSDNGEIINENAQSVKELKTTVDKLYKHKTIQNNDFTNIALLEPFYKPIESSGSNNEYAYRIYVSGSGTDRKLELSWREWQANEKMGAGLGQGSTGPIQKVIDAFSCINNKLNFFHKKKVKSIKLFFHVFGFSRGATESRLFAHVINVLRKGKSITVMYDSSDVSAAQKIAKELHEVLDENRYWNDKLVSMKNIVENGKINQSITVIKIPSMGIYDTVSSVGVLENSQRLNKIVKTIEDMSSAKSKSHHQNVKDLGLNDLEMVDDVYHICALDEYRENFALVPIDDCSAKEKKQVYIPGCHSDVGGGYPEGFDKQIIFKEKDFYMPKEIVPYHIREKQNQQQYFTNDNNNWFQFTIEDLKRNGWLDKGKDLIEDIQDTVSFKRYSKKGYSYIGLRLMIEKYKSCFKFDESKFSIAKDKLLKDVYMAAISLSDNQCTKLDENTYIDLRNYYLHLSMDDGMVNKPNYYQNGKTEKYVWRIEYTNDYCADVEKRIKGNSEIKSDTKQEMKKRHPSRIS